MAIQTTCDFCFDTFSVPDKFAGKRVRCTGCGQPTAVGAGRGASPPMLRRGSAGRSASKSGVSTQALVGIGAGAGVLVAAGVVVGVMLGRGDDAAAPVSVAEANVAPAPIESAVPVFGAADVSVAMPEIVEEAASLAVTETSSPVAAFASPVGDVSATNGAQLGTVASTAAASSGTESTGAEVAAAADGSGRPVARTEKLELVDLIALVEPSVVRLNMVTKDGSSQGSGFVADGRGNVITNYHVIEGATKGFAIFADGREVPLKGYSYVDPNRDMAVVVLDLPSGTVPAVPIAGALPRKGEQVYGFGAPHGLNFTTSEGIVSAIRPEKEMHDLLGTGYKGMWLQTTAPISGGSSGGPLVDSAGNVVGINTLTHAEGQNLNFAVSCLELGDALARAGSELKAFRPEDLKEKDLRATRDAAPDEIGTERGQRLFAATEEIFLINLARRANFDPTGRLWRTVILHSQRSVEKSGVELSFGEPAADAAVMLVFMQLKPIRGGAPGTQEMVLKADLICYDANAPESRRYCRVWHGEETAGTVSLLSLASGTIPTRLDGGLRKFFMGFRQARTAAVNAQKATAEGKEAGAGDGEKAGG